MPAAPPSNSPDVAHGPLMEEAVQTPQAAKETRRRSRRKCHRRAVAAAGARGRRCRCRGRRGRKEAGRGEARRRSPTSRSPSRPRPRRSPLRRRASRRSRHPPRPIRCRRVGRAWRGSRQAGRRRSSPTSTASSAIRMPRASAGARRGRCGVHHRPRRPVVPRTWRKAPARPPSTRRRWRCSSGPARCRRRRTRSRAEARPGAADPVPDQIATTGWPACTHKLRPNYSPWGRASTAICVTKEVACR